MGGPPAPRKTGGVSGAAGSSPLTEEGKQPPFPKMTVALSPHPSERELTSVQGFGVTYPLPQLSLRTIFLSASPPRGPVQPGQQRPGLCLTPVSFGL